MWLPALLAWSGAVQAQQPQGFDVGMYVDVAADGSVTAVEVPGDVLPVLRDSLVRRALQWHFTPATWQGEPVAVRQWLPVKLEPVLTSDGGYAIRILGTGLATEPGTAMVAPKYPKGAMRAGVTATLVYQVHVAEDGRMTPLALLESPGLNGYVKDLDKASRAALSASRIRPFVANGQVVACELRFPIDFLLDDTGDAKKEPGPPLPDGCPNAKLETAITGMML